MRTPGETLLFRASATKNILVAVFCLVWALSLYMKVHTGRVYTHEGVFLCNAGAALFTLFALISLSLTVRALPTLLLTEKGFELHGGLDRHSYLWTECYDFHVAQPFIRFRRRGYGDAMILNQFSGTSLEICAALASWQAKYAGDAA